MLMLGVLALAVVGGAFVFAFSRAAQRKKAAAGWDAAPGRILESRLGQERDADGGSAWTYFPVIRYAYAVKGVERTGSRIAFGNVRSANSKKARSWCERFPQGAEVPVFHDPKKPDDSVLDRG